MRVVGRMCVAERSWGVYMGSTEREEITPLIVGQNKSGES